MLAITFGIIVGVSLGLTGGGGSILAVPMLVHGLAMDPKHAAGVSLAAVGSTALVGAIERIARREVDLLIGFMFGFAGILGAPIGVAIRRHTPADLLLILFSMLMLIVAVLMWMRARAVQNASAVHVQHSTRYGLMAFLGLTTGVLSGIFGVGGGFIIVPALVLVSGMPVHRAVATSLLVIPLTSASGVLAQAIGHDPLEWHVTALFVAGGILGMFAGSALCRQLPAILLQKTFAVVIVLVAIFNGLATIWWHR